MIFQKVKFVFFKDVKSALLPKTNPKAPSKMDLPAPVSPVIVENPLEKSMDNFSIKAKFSIESDGIIYSCGSEKVN